jgi:GT2 family glycosyltransferase
VTDTGRLEIVITSRDRRSRLLGTLARLDALGEGWPVTVVDDGSVDATSAAVASAHPEVTLLRLDASRGAAARNLGVHRSSAPYVAFCDDDSGWAPDALARAVGILDDAPTVGALAARVLTGRSRQPDPICEQLAASPLSGWAGLPGPRVLGFLACGAVVRREAFLAVGGFHPRFGIGGEEELLAIDLAVRGWWCCYVPEVVAIHEPARRSSRGAREVRQVRNALWTAALRRPLRPMVRRAIDILGSPAAEGRRGAVLATAIRGAGFLLAGRRVVPPYVEADLERLEDRSDGARLNRLGCG